MNEKQSKIYVSNFLKGFGFNCVFNKTPCSSGTDLYAIKNDTVIKIEVKRVGCAKNSFRVSAVCEKRKQDDLIAYVFPSGLVMLENMDSHLKLCSKGGERQLGQLSNIYK
jgi:hypothetical protein